MKAATSAASSSASGLSRLSLQQSVPSSSLAPLFPVQQQQQQQSPFSAGYAGSSSAAAARSSCSSLTDLCLQHYCAHLDDLGVSNLQCVPEPLAYELLCMVLQQSRLTPRLVRLFAACGHASVVGWIKQNVNVEATIMIDATHSCRPTRH